MTNAWGAVVGEGKNGTRERVLDAAERGALAVGMTRLRVGQVAVDAGVSRQTVYNAFGDKLGLAQAVAIRVAGRLLDGVERELATHTDPSAAIAGAMRFVLDTAAQLPLIQLTLNREKDDDMIALLTTEAGPVLDYVRGRLTLACATLWPQYGRAQIALVTEVATRLSISYLVCPTEPVDASVATLTQIVDAVLKAPNPAP